VVVVVDVDKPTDEAEVVCFSTPRGEVVPKDVLLVASIAKNGRALLAEIVPERDGGGEGRQRRYLGDE